MMIHHDSRSYQQAASEAGKIMREKLHAKIAEAKTRSITALQRIQDEIPEDRLAYARALDFEAAPSQLCVQMQAGAPALTIHPWALAQLSESFGVPYKFLQGLVLNPDDWAGKLAAHTLQEIADHRNTKHLIRAVGTQVRGIMSPRYQRRHPGILIDAFVDEGKKHGLLMHSAWCSDTKHAVRAVLDRTIEPVPGEVLGIGVVYGESPYGNGATELSITVERMFCTNLAVVEQSLRTVHMGSNLSDDVQWSEDTYRKDTELTASKIRDMLSNNISDTALARLAKGVQDANAQKIKPEAFENFLKKHLDKPQVAEVKAIFTSADVELLPAGNTAWRASNAISAFANQQDNPEEAFALQKLAGKALALGRAGT